MKWEAKERDLLTGGIGQEKTCQLIAAIWDLESLKSVRDLRPLLTVCFKLFVQSNQTTRWLGYHRVVFHSLCKVGGSSASPNL